MVEISLEDYIIVQRDYNKDTVVEVILDTIRVQTILSIPYSKALDYVRMDYEIEKNKPSGSFMELI